MQFSLKTKISTTRLRSTKAFYERIFRMSVVDEWDNPGDAGVILAFGNGRREAPLEIYRAERPLEHAGLSLQFRVERLADFMATLPDDLEFDGPTERPWGSTYLYLRDPNDIQVIVYEGGL